MTTLKDRPQRSVFATLGLTMKSNIRLDAPMGGKVFINQKIGWVKREEAAKLQAQKTAVIDPRLIRLDELEKKVIKGCEEFLAIGEALEEIKEKKLYLLRADTWGQYCKERLGRSVGAVRQQIKAFQLFAELSEEKSEEKCHGVTKSPLISSDLSADQATTPMEITTEKVKAARKQVRLPEQQNRPRTTVADFDTALAAALIMPETELQPRPEDLLDEIITRIRRSKHNLNFLKALKEWLDESAI